VEHNLLHSGQRGLGIANVTKLGFTDKSDALKKLHEITKRRERDFTPNSNFDELIQKERNDSWKYGGRTGSGNAEPPQKGQGLQLELF
jgi:uncharacterized protein